MAMRLKAQQAKQDYETAARSLDAANAQVARIEGDLARIRAQIAQMEEALSNLNLQIAAARAALAPLKDRLDAAKRDYEQAQSLAQGAENDARQAQTQASAARTRANQLQAQFETSQRRLAELRQGVADRQNRFTALQRAIENWVSEQETERRNLVAADQRNRQLVPALNQQRRALADAQRELNESERDRDQALRVVANEDALVRGNLARLEEVRRNLADGIAAASNTGRDDGFSDGAQEGERVARINANTQGRDIGEREGRVSGTREGIENARRRGQTEGSELGQNEGRQTGDREGRSRGQEEGRTNGKAAGLQEGYQLGRDEGYRETYPRGEADGHKQGGYDKGKREGYAQGKSRGETDGRAKGDADGKREGHDRFLNAELQNVTLPNRAPSMSATFDHPQWDNYNPRRRYTQHPAMQDAYNETYRQSFFSAAADRYDAVFPGLYEQIRRDAFEATRQDYANRSYPAEQKEAFDRAYSESFENARRIADRAGYDAVYPTAYDQARIAALPIRRDEGLRDGRTAGYEEGKRNAYNADFARGRSDGERMGYDETFNNTYLATKKAAYDEVVAYYTNNAVLKYDGVVLKDANDDGIYAPGEPVTVAVAIKNFGLASQRDDVVVQAQNPTRGLIIERGSEVLVGLPGQARAVVTGVTQLRVAPTVEVGTPQSVDVNVLSAGKTIGKARLDLKTGYPYLIANINKPDHPTPNSPNQVSVDVRNTSSKQSNTDVTVRLVSLDNLAETTTETINLGALASGETRSAQLGFQFREENANKTLQFEVQIFEGDWLLGKQRFTTDTAKRWNFTPTAAGLIVVDTAKRANRAELVAKALSLGYDTWDVRVEGPLANQALKYVDKSIILLSVNASYNKVTANALGNYLSRGGQLLVGVGSGTDRTDVGQMIKRMEAMVSSTATFGGLSLFASNDFKPTEPKFLIAEMRDTSNEDGVNTLAARVAEFNVVRKSLDEKVATYLAAVASGDAESVALSKQAIERDLIKEMLDNRAAKTNSYKKNKAALKLTAYINILVTKQDVERKALAMVYPELEKTRKKIEKSGWFKSEPIKGVMGPLKRAYNRDVLGRRGD
jgi:hypothetical protein